MAGEKRHARWWVRACVLGVVASAACAGGGGGDGGGGPAGSRDDGAALARAFQEEAQAAYDGAGRNRSDDWQRGVVLDECPILTAEGTAEVVDALGVDGGRAGAQPEVRGAFLEGNPEVRETVGCTIVLGDDEPTVSVAAGTIDQERDVALASLRAGPGGDDVLEVTGEASGLAGGDVLAVTRDRGAIAVVAWISDGFQVVLNVPAEVASPDDALRALPEAVDQVAAAIRR